MTLKTLFIIYFAKNSLTPLSQSSPVSSPVKNRPRKPLPTDTKVNTCYRGLIGFLSTQKKPGKYTNKFHLPGLFIFLKPLSSFDI